MIGSMRMRCGMVAVLAICLAGSPVRSDADEYPYALKWPSLDVTPCSDFPTSLGSTEFVVTMCDGNFFKMELADAALTKARDAVILQYSVTFGKRGGKLLPDGYTDSKLIISAEAALLGEDVPCMEVFGPAFTFSLGDSHVSLALDKDSRSATTIVSAKEGYTLSIAVPVSKLGSHMRPIASEWDFEKKPLMWTPAAILDIECVNVTKAGGKAWAGYGFYVHLPLCDENLWDLRKEMNVSEPKATAQVSPAPQTPEKTP